MDLVAEIMPTGKAISMETRVAMAVSVSVIGNLLAIAVVTCSLPWNEFPRSKVRMPRIVCHNWTRYD
ncbi:hypothetical protein D3C87_2168300 [compost metagenome]